MLFAAAAGCSAEAEKDPTNDSGTDTAADSDTGEAAPVEEEEQEEEEPAEEQVLNYAGDLTIEIETQWGIDRAKAR